MVERLLELKSKLDEMLCSAMQRNEAFANSLKEAFESFINQRQSKPAELIAKFIDGCMRSGGMKGQTEDELESILDKVLVLFRYIQVSPCNLYCGILWTTFFSLRACICKDHIPFICSGQGCI